MTFEIPEMGDVDDEGEEEEEDDGDDEGNRAQLSAAM